MLPPFLEVVLSRQKGPGEIVVALYAAHDLVQRNLLQSQVAHVTQQELPAGLFEADQADRALP
jgi:hypothetical protein